MVELQDRYDNACDLREEGSRLVLHLAPRDDAGLDLQGTARLDRNSGGATVREVVCRTSKGSWRIHCGRQLEGGPTGAARTLMLQHDNRWFDGGCWRRNAQFKNVRVQVECPRTYAVEPAGTAPLSDLAGGIGSAGAGVGSGFGTGSPLPLLAPRTTAPVRILVLGCCLARGVGDMLALL